MNIYGLNRIVLRYEAAGFDHIHMHFNRTGGYHGVFLLGRWTL